MIASRVNPKESSRETSPSKILVDDEKGGQEHGESGGLRQAGIAGQT